MKAIDEDHYKQFRLHTPFHDRVAELSQLDDWEEWKGYTIVSTVEDLGYEYFSIRNSCSVFDLTPMSKYRIRGEQAQAFLDRLVTRNISKLRVGRVGYSCWCTDQGKIIDDGTIFHLAENDYRLCAQERQLEWLLLSSLGFDVEIFEETHDVAALSLQGPTSCAVLKVMGLTGIETLKPFGITTFDFEGGELMVSRTGFTADLGYELWVEPSLALALWDRLFEAGKNHGIRLIGDAALSMARVEAGFVQAGVDFSPANQTIRLDHDRSPFEVDLGWLVDLTKPNFTGKKALLAEKKKGSKFKLARLYVEGNKPAKDSYIYLGKGRKKVGTVNSAIWSPTAKANIALASVETPYGELGDDLWAEIYYQRDLRWNKVWARCTVTDKPFWDPPRRRATPPADF